MTQTDDFGSFADAPPPVPAATLVIFRHDPAGGAAQLLMVERSRSMKFAGGAAVFPGGRVDPADYELAARLNAGELNARMPEDEAAHRIAAIRETLEETGLALGIDQPVSGEEAVAARALLLKCGTLAPVLEQLGWTLALEHLVPFARWRPAHRRARIFDTRFYLYDIGTGAVDITVDATENHHMFWASAAEALALAEQKRIHIIFPTRRNLERLAQFATFAECRAHAEAVPVRIITPRVTDRGGVPWLTIPADAGYPKDGELFETATRG